MLLLFPQDRSTAVSLRRKAEARPLILVKEVDLNGPQRAWRDFNTIAAPCTPAANRYVSFCVVSMSLITGSER